MVRGLSKAVANNRAMIKLKPSLPANNNKNLSSDNTLEYVGFWQQKALLHFTNSAYKGTFLISVNFF
jgi:type VI protein secretion system component VasA